jgi:hypothetical protein
MTGYRNKIRLLAAGNGPDRFHDRAVDDAFSSSDPFLAKAIL